MKCSQYASLPWLVLMLFFPRLIAVMALLLDPVMRAETSASAFSYSTGLAVLIAMVFMSGLSFGGTLYREILTASGQMMWLNVIFLNILSWANGYKLLILSIVILFFYIKNLRSLRKALEDFQSSNFFQLSKFLEGSALLLGIFLDIGVGVFFFARY